LLCRPRVIATYAIAREAPPQNRIRTVGRDALRRMHRRRVAQRDVFFEVVVLEHRAGVVGESFGGKPIGVRIDRGHPPAVAVADLINRTGAVVAGAGFDVDGGVVASARDDVADADFLVARGFDGRAGGW
jgi:hypothetical protein